MTNERLTPDKLWSNTCEYLGKVLPGDTDMKTFNEVARKVYDQMAFLVAGKPHPDEPSAPRDMTYNYCEPHGRLFLKSEGCSMCAVNRGAEHEG